MFYATTMIQPSGDPPPPTLENLNLKSIANEWICRIKTKPINSIDFEKVKSSAEIANHKSQRRVNHSAFVQPVCVAGCITIFKYIKANTKYMQIWIDWNKFYLYQIDK